MTDPRLALLPENIFKGKCVLDIGCNEGWVTCEIGDFLLATTLLLTLNILAQGWNAQKVVGVDIDDALVRAAWKRRQFVWSLQEPQPHQSLMEADENARSLSADYFPASLQHSFGPLPIPPSKIRGKSSFPHNVVFRTADWTKESIIEDADGYDVVIASVASFSLHAI